MIQLQHLILLLSISVCSSQTSPTRTDSNPALRDNVRSQSCVFNGAFDEQNQICEGRAIFYTPNDTIKVGLDQNNLINCLTMIQPNSSVNSTLHLRFDNVEGSCKGNFLKVFDGDSANGPLLATFYGDVFPTQSPEVVSSTGSITVRLYNNGDNITDPGYNMTYWLESDGATSSGTEISPDRQGRASTDAALVDNVVYMFGGYTTEKSDQWKNFVRLNLTSMTLQSVGVNMSGSMPKVRRDHSMVSWGNDLIMFGGAFSNGAITNEIWKFDTNQSVWTLVGANLTSGKEVPFLIGHSAHVTQLNDSRDVMLVFFGYHPRWQFSPFVFQLDLNTYEWSVVETGGATPTATYAHASTIDQSSKVVYVHGGFNAVAINNLYSYDVDQHYWTVLRPSSDPYYLHSMSILSGYLYLIGGKSISQESANCSTCRRASTLIYNIDCNSWNVSGDIASGRYGHSVVELNRSSLLLYGGYDGSILTDIVTYDTAMLDCNSLNQSECDNLSSCNWDDSTCNHACSSGEFACQQLCSSLTNCTSCLSSNCPCCYDYATSSCSLNSSYSSCATEERNVSSCVVEVESPSKSCSKYAACELCHDANCTWTNDLCVYQPENDTTLKTCPRSCTDSDSCSDCSQRNGCIWCESTNTCLPQESTLVYYPYGSCTEYISSISPRRACNADPCSRHSNCDDCSRDERCGWCDLGSVTGLGGCMLGGSDGPMNLSYCSKEQWNFFDCPDCQCNGHSICSVSKPDVCTQCDSGIIGPTCDECDSLYYGNPANGRNCSECECNNHAHYCSSTGQCTCFVEGMYGFQCNKCYSAGGFNGNPINETCFYTIAVMTKYLYSFRAGAVDNSFPRQLNFDSCPTHNSDVTVNLITNFPVNITVTVNPTGGDEIFVAFQPNSTSFALKLGQNEYRFGGVFQPCIRIYISDIYPGTSVTVWLLQNLTNVGILVAVFLVCFIALLLLALLVWKSNDLLMRIRRRRNVRVEMQRLAARPIAVVHYDFENNRVAEREKMINHVACEEICVGDKVVICTSLLSLPSTSGSDNFRELAFGSCLVNRHNYQHPPEQEPPTSSLQSRAYLNPFTAIRNARTKAAPKRKPNNATVAFDNLALDVPENV